MSGRQTTGKHILTVEGIQEMSEGLFKPRNLMILAFVVVPVYGFVILRLLRKASARLGKP